MTKEKMSAYKAFLIVLTFSLQIGYSSEAVPVAAIIKVGGTALNILELGQQAAGIVQSIFGSSSGTSGGLTNEQMIIRIEDMIETATTAILQTIFIQSKFDRLEKIISVIHSLLVELKNLLKASTTKDQQNMANLFKLRFESAGAEISIRYLPTLLTTSAVPGSPAPLLSLVANSVRCNTTAMDNFKIFYLRLISDGIALEWVYLILSDIKTDDQTEYWKNRVIQMADFFREEDERCAMNFGKYASEDVSSIQSARKLWNTVKSRSKMTWSDVMFYPDFGTFQFHYYRHGDRFLWSRSDDLNRVLIYGEIHQDTLWRVSDVNRTLARSVDMFRGNVTDKDDVDAAKHVGEAVEAVLKSKGYKFRDLIVFFDGEDFTTQSVILDKDSPVASVSVDGIELEYCYDSGVLCYLDWGSNVKTVNGNFRIYVYPQRRLNEDIAYITSNGNDVKICGSLLLLYIAFTLSQ